jgi:hypothetical protein
MVILFLSMRHFWRETLSSRLTTVRATESSESRERIEGSSRKDCEGETVKKDDGSIVEGTIHNNMNLHEHIIMGLCAVCK